MWVYMLVEWCSLQTCRKTDVRASACETKSKDGNLLAETVCCIVSSGPLSWKDQGVVLRRMSLWRTHTSASTKFTFSFTKTYPHFVTTMQGAIHLEVDHRCLKIRVCNVYRATVIKGGMSPHILEKLTGDTRDYRQTLTISDHNFCCIWLYLVIISWGRTTRSRSLWSISAHHDIECDWIFMPAHSRYLVRGRCLGKVFHFTQLLLSSEEERNVKRTTTKILQRQTNLISPPQDETEQDFHFLSSFLLPPVFFFFSLPSCFLPHTNRLPHVHPHPFPQEHSALRARSSSSNAHPWSTSQACCTRSL